MPKVYSLDANKNFLDIIKIVRPKIYNTVIGNRTGLEILRHTVPLLWF